MVLRQNGSGAGPVLRWLSQRDRDPKLAHADDLLNRWHFLAGPKATAPVAVVAVHRAGVRPARLLRRPADLAPEKRTWLETAAAWAATGRAYAAMHETKPQTAAFGLTASPVGLAAWIVE